MKTGLLFSGQGAQCVGMAKSLYEAHSEVKELFERADSALGLPLSKYCFEGPIEELTKTNICQVALYIHGISVATILKKRGALDNLECALGLSLGELTAHAIAGTYDFETGLKIVEKRGALMQMACEASKGAMLCLIGGSLDLAKEYCQEFDVEIANLNCTGQIVISGDADKIGKAGAKVAETKDFKMAVPLKVAGAYHSKLMEPAREEFAKFLADIEFKKPNIKVFTNTTAEEISDPVAIKEALIKQVVMSVRWQDCMENAAKLGVEQFYECGPGGVLAGMAKRINRAYNVKSIADEKDF
ncbi:MAG: ACP S-malonyltransferase [Opitutales bacterium]